MIGLETIRNNIQTALNTNSFGKVFRLYTNDGEFKNAFRDGNDITEYINGICRISTSSLTPLKSLSILTMSVEVEFCIRVDNLEKDNNGNYIEVLNIQALCENFVNSQNGQTITLTEEGKTYVLAVNTEMPIVGVERLITPLGKCMPITLQLFYTMVENGINSNDISLYIGNEEVPYTDLTIDRVFVNTVAQKLIEEVGKTANEQNSVSISFIAPLTNTPLGKDYTNILLDGGNNVAFPVVIDYKTLNKRKEYTMTFSSLKNTSSGIQNVGVQGTLVEVDTNVADYRDLNVGDWVFEKISIYLDYANAFLTIDGFQTGDLYYIDWGDGNTESGNYTGTAIRHNYAQTGKYNVAVFSKDAPIYSIFNQLILPTGDDFTISVESDKPYADGYVKYDLRYSPPKVTLIVNFSQSGTYDNLVFYINNQPYPASADNKQTFEMVEGTRIALTYQKVEDYYKYDISPTAQTLYYTDGQQLVNESSGYPKIEVSYFKDNVWNENVANYLVSSTDKEYSIKTTYQNQEYSFNFTLSDTKLVILSTSTFDPSIEKWGLKFKIWESVIVNSGA